MQASGRPYHWRSALVLDAYGRYNFGKNLSMNFSVSNLTNRYYLDPMSNVPHPRTGTGGYRRVYRQILTGQSLRAV